MLTARGGFWWPVGGLESTRPRDIVPPASRRRGPVRSLRSRHGELVRLRHVQGRGFLQGAGPGPEKPVVAYEIAPSTPSARLRRWCTGEAWQALAAAGMCGEIPAAVDVEQAYLETELLTRLRGLGSMSPHPLGILQTRPDPERLALQLLAEPYVVRYWADLLVPWVDEADEDPRDAVSGAAGLRWWCHGQGVDLTRPGTAARVRLTGFPSRWWARAVDSRARSCQYGELINADGWTDVERAAEAGWRTLYGRDPQVGSAVLRRIRATAGPWGANGLSVWSDRVDGGAQWVVEATYGPTCDRVLALFTSGPTDAGWRIKQQHCYCHDITDAGCTAVLDAGNRQEIWYRNLNWQRLMPQRDRSAAVAERNAAAFT